MKILLNSCYGGLGFSKELEEVFKEKFGTCNPYALRTNQNAIAIIEEWIEDGKEASGDYSNIYIEDLPKGTRYIIDEYDGIESLVTEENIQWEVAE